MGIHLLQPCHHVIPITDHENLIPTARALEKLWHSKLMGDPHSGNYTSLATDFRNTHEQATMQTQ